MCNTHSILLRHGDTNKDNTINFEKYDTKAKEISKKVSEIIKEHISQTGTYQETQNCPGEIVLNIGFRITEVFMLKPVGREQIENYERNNIHQSVVAHLKLPDLKYIRPDMFR